jgi:hypothetical protein
MAWSCGKGLEVGVGFIIGVHHYLGLLTFTGLKLPLVKVCYNLQW